MDGYNEQPSPDMHSGGFDLVSKALSSVNIKDKRTKDGQIPKRRGPKPDAKPALNRRQALNRQAQRTHRERKEAYVKDLESQVVTLRNSLLETIDENKRITEITRQLSDFVSRSGLPLPPHILMALQNLPRSESQMGSDTASASGGFQSYGSISGASSSVPPGGYVDYSGVGPAGVHLSPPVKQPYDHDQVAVDFVLTLERPCMEHMPFLVDRSLDSPVPLPCGHSLMISCPPHGHSEIPEHVAWAHDAVPSNPPQPLFDGHKPMHSWQTEKSGLAKLLQISETFDLQGEITPVQAWKLISMHERFHELTHEDILHLREELSQRSHCYGFGAVVEDFEVRDALENILAAKF